MAPLTGRTALVTGVSRRAGIGYAVARRLVADGAAVACHGWRPHDAEQPWGAEDDAPAALAAELGAAGAIEADLARPGACGAVVAGAAELVGHLDVLVVNHARSSEQSLEDLTEEELDESWRVNARAPLLLVQAFAARHDDRRPGGRVVLFTSGQHRGPMTRELAYAVTKGAVHQATLTLADALADRGITVNTVNPGPTDTGWADPELTARVGAALPRGRWNTPDEAAAVVAWLVSDDAASVTGHVLDAEGGFRRWGA